MTSVTHPPAYRILDFHFGVDCSDPVLQQLVDRIFSPFHVDGPAATAYTVTEVAADDYYAEVWFGTERVTSSVERSGTLTMLLWDINRRIALASADRWLVLHGAAAASGGAAVALCAPTESGKSTLVTALVRAGFDYLTDEFLAINPDDLRVHPVPKAIALDPGSWPLFPELAPALEPAAAAYAMCQWQVLVQGWRPDQVISAPVPLRHLVLPRYVPGAGTRLLPLSRADALIACAGQTFGWPRHPERYLTILGNLIRGVCCHRLEFGDLGTAVEVVSGLLRRAG